MPRVTLRRWGFNATHRADVPEDAILRAEAFNGFYAVEAPAAARCGTILRGGGRAGTVGRLLVVMNAGTPVTCRACEVLE